MNRYKLRLTLILPLVLSSAALTQPTNPHQSSPMILGHPGMMGQGMMMGSMVRHHQAMMYGIPEPYRSAHNPLPNSISTFERGAQVYARSCVSCHGAKGYGDGPVAQQLSPRPADLTWLGHSHMVGDQYIYWTVAEGGRPVGSAMPAFKGVLERRDIWAVVTYVRDGLGSAARR